MDFKLLQKVVDELNSTNSTNDKKVILAKYKNDEFIKKVLDKKYTFEFCGSYRRQKNTSNDIDILITSKETGNLNNIIESLKEKNQMKF